MNLYEILQNSGRVGEGMTHFERLFAQKVGGGKINEISGAPPLRYIGDGRPLTDYMLYGNALQDGTPTPEAPVDVVGCGEKTGNLAYGRIENANISSNGTIARLNGNDIAIGRVESGIVYTANAYVYAFYTNEPMSIGDVSYDGSRIVGTVGEPSTFTAPITGYVAFRIGSGEQAMLNTGSSALPYEPYGYKLPLTVNGAEYPIYLGRVESTRRVKKLVLTGEENSWTDLDVYYTVNARNVRSWTSCRCSHCEYGGVIGGNSTTRLWIKKASFPNCVSLADFKSYLAAQYAAGKPVTVWYVLADPETAIVNEPLMKIGDYADTISFAQAGVTIPTENGENVLDVPTEVKPSEVWIRGRIKEV